MSALGAHGEVLDMEHQWMLLTCAECFSAAAPVGSSFAKCGGCSSVKYCNRTCQQKHWKRGHKSHCPELKKERDEREAVDSEVPQLVPLESGP